MARSKLYFYLSSLLVIIILIAAICIMILSLYLIKIITALFTKKCTETDSNERVSAQSTL